MEKGINSETCDKEFYFILNAFDDAILNFASFSPKPAPFEQSQFFSKDNNKRIAYDMINKYVYSGGKRVDFILKKIHKNSGFLAKNTI